MHFARFIDGSIRYEHDASLVNRWPEADPLRLRMYAMIGVGTMWIAADRWSVEGSDRRLLGYLDDGFKMIDTERDEAAASLKGK